MLIKWLIGVTAVVGCSTFLLGSNAIPFLTVAIFCGGPAYLLFMVLRRFGLDKRISWTLSTLAIPKELKRFSQETLRSKDFSEMRFAKWRAILASVNLSKTMEIKFKIIEFAKLLHEFSRDRKLDDKEWEIVQSARKFYDHELSESGPVTLSQLGDWRARGIVSEGRLIEMNLSELPITAKSDERLFLLLPAALVKRKKVTTRVNYSGITGSIRLGGGFRYQVGSIQPQRISEERIVSEDIGVFWVSDQRCGYHGKRKSWSMPISKLNDVQVEERVILEIFKDGRENPILIVPSDLDYACAVLSLIMNGDYEVSPDKAAI
jgi:hypothetical protein